MDIENKSTLHKTELTAVQSLGRPPYGDPIRKQKAINPLPSELYLIYITNDQGKLVVRHVNGSIDNTRLTQEEERLANLAANGNQKSHFETIVFKNPSYFTIVLDIADWVFYYPFPNNPKFSDTEVQDPIVFYDAKAFWMEVNGALVKETHIYEENFAFYSLEEVPLKVNGVPKKAIRCVNHFVDESGNEPGTNEAIKYGFNINLLAPFSNPKGLKNIILTIDPDGQNQGPTG
jgi:hypothetical protein